MSDMYKLDPEFEEAIIGVLTGNTLNEGEEPKHYPESEFPVGSTVHPTLSGPAGDSYGGPRIVTKHTNKHIIVSDGEYEYRYSKVHGGGIDYTSAYKLAKPEEVEAHNKKQEEMRRIEDAHASIHAGLRKITPAGRIHKMTKADAKAMKAHIDTLTDHSKE